VSSVQFAQALLDVQICPFVHWAPVWQVPVTQAPETQMKPVP
jgi:hypothetical protein